MDINKINNAQIITEAFAKGFNKINNTNVLAFNSRSKKLPFSSVLYNESRSTDNLNTLRRPEKHFIPLNNPKRNHYPEQIFRSKGIDKPAKPSIIEQYKIYKEDQLMSNPGGDNYFLNKSNKVKDEYYNHSRITKRIGKDLTDAGSNLLNVFKDLGFGARIKYVDKLGNVNDGRKVGLTGTMVNFLKNIASGLSFGFFSSEGEPKPHGGVSRIRHLFKKIIKEALIGDVVKGIPKSVIHIGEDIMFAGLNTAEVVPDATIGNLDAGRKFTTAVFDNTQVVMDFATDILPGGEAFTRTRSYKLAKGIKGLPIINNLTMSKEEQDEKDWRYVRNTSFRKVIETIPSFIPFRI